MITHAIVDLHNIAAEASMEKKTKASICEASGKASERTNI